MTERAAIPLRFDLLRVGHCGHPECIAMRGGRWNSVEFPALVGLIDHPREGLVLYDTGYSRHFHRATRSFPECLYRLVTPVSLPPEEELLCQLEDRGIRAGDIGTIVISHFHADHVAGLRDFPRARFVATRAEKMENERRGRFGRARRAYLRELLPDDFEARAIWAPDLPETPMPWPEWGRGWDLLGDGSLVGVNLPGHVASQLGIVFSTEEHGQVFLVGDASWKIEALAENRPPGRVAYTLFADGTSYDRTFAALRDLHASPLAPLIVPSHCHTTWRRVGGTRHVHRA
ncbi:MAG: MBL fold metallo-hydrolase [Verrucomicrobiae bacterium]|nr:MBL fold metallo-hydrolase [Verrucomicrobiae bacterium]